MVVPVDYIIERIFPYLVGLRSIPNHNPVVK